MVSAEGDRTLSAAKATARGARIPAVTKAELAGMVLPGLATGVGGLGLLLVHKPSARTLDVLLGFTAGVMLAATAFSLLVPALDEGSAWEITAAMLAGGAVLLALDHFIPHAHGRFTEGDHPARADQPEPLPHRARLLISAMAIHNIPEGFAVGVAFAAGGVDLGLPIAVAIGLQNIPEGFATAAPLLQAGRSPLRGAGVAALTGLAEPVAALAAFAAVGLFSALLPVALAFAAGAMLYVIVDELIPEAHSRGFEREVTVALFLGFAVMMILDTALA